MGINMEIKMVAGIKYDKLPGNIVDEDGEFLSKDTKLSHYPDCYAGEWDIIGIEVNSSQDNKYTPQDFSWSLTKSNIDTLTDIAREELSKLGILLEPSLIVFTYYT